MKNLLKSVFVIWILTSFQQSAFGQNVETDPKSKSAIKELGFMVGNWEGKGWMIGADRNRHEFNQTEQIQFKIDSTALLIEGQGIANNIVVHNALAIVTFAGEENHYDFNSFLQNGRKGAFKAEIKDQVFYWYPSESMRYIIQINEAGQWYEIGEINTGDSWFKFFEMTLDKK